MKHFWKNDWWKYCLAMQAPYANGSIILCAAAMLIFFVGYFIGKSYVLSTYHAAHADGLGYMMEHEFDSLLKKGKTYQTERDEHANSLGYAHISLAEAQRAANRLQKMGIATTIIQQISKAINGDGKPAVTIWYQIVRR